MIAKLLQARLRADPDRVALVDAGRALSAGELDAAAVRWASILAGRRRVGFLADNGSALVEALLGALYAGAAVVPFHAGTPMPELAARVRRFGVDVLVSDRELDVGCERLALGLSATAEVEPARTLGPDPDGEALLLGTSGTTGEPRAVVVSHAGLAAHAEALAARIGLGPDDRVLAALPLAHSYGSRVALLVPLISGARVVLARRFSARGALALIEEASITWVPAVPTMLSAWAAVPAEPDQVRAPGRLPRERRSWIGHLRWVLSAGAPLPEAVRVAAEARLGCVVREGYGLTEASFTTIDAPPAPPAPGTVGRPVPGVEVRLDGTTHEVQVRGVNVMAGYLDDPEGTRAAFTADGWLRTGDVGAWDARGNLRIVDRIKDIILSGGHTIYPAEVEAVLASHPDVESVAVVGRPDPHLGEAVVAHVVWRDGTARDAPSLLTDWSKGQLAPYKVPAAVVTHAELPLGPSGKVLKRRLRDGCEPWSAGGGG